MADRASRVNARGVRFRGLILLLAFIPLSAIAPAQASEQPGWLRKVGSGLIKTLKDFATCESRLLPAPPKASDELSLIAVGRRSDSIRSRGFSWVVSWIDQLHIDLSRVDDLERLAQTLSRGKSSEEAFSKLVAAKFNGLKHIPLLDFLPQFAHVYTGLKAQTDDPNCYNAAMNWYGWVFGPGYADPDEFQGWVDGRCTPITPDEARFGDLVVVRGYREQDFQVVPKHAMILLNSRFIWHKASHFQIDRWVFSSFHEAVQPYASGINALHYFRCRERQ